MHKSMPGIKSEQNDIFFDTSKERSDMFSHLNFSLFTCKLTVAQTHSLVKPQTVTLAWGWITSRLMVYFVL